MTLKRFYLVVGALVALLGGLVHAAEFDLAGVWRLTQANAKAEISEVDGVWTVRLATDVPRFGESELMEFDVPLDPSARAIAFMSEAAGRFRFRERREVIGSANFPMPTHNAIP